MAPNLGEMKLKIDGATFSEQHRVGMGRVLKNDWGRVVMAASKLKRQQMTRWSLAIGFIP